MTDISSFTGKKRKLLEYMLDPEHQHKSVTDVCEAVGVSRTYYYACVKDEKFDITLKDVKNRCFSRYQAQVDRKISEQAVAGDPKSARLFYEIQGQVGGRGNTVNVGVGMSKDTEPQTLKIDTLEEVEGAIAQCKAERATLDELITNLENMRGAFGSENEPGPVERPDRLKAE